LVPGPALGTPGMKEKFIFTGWPASAMVSCFDFVSGSFKHRKCGNSKGNQLHYGDYLAKATKYTSIFKKNHDPEAYLPLFLLEFNIRIF
jgi:hypothetical protein